MVEIAGVSKVYQNGTQALDCIDLAVAPGEILSLVGPSGCGKSTLLRIVAGLGDATEGMVLIDGVPAGSPKAREKASFVFQEPTLLPWCNVAANVELPLRLCGLAPKERRERVEEALRLVGLSEFRKAYPRELSGGMKMRVSIARALVTRPQLILMDEPFGALDEITRQRLNQELLRVHAHTGCTVVFVTHNVFEAVYLSHRVAVMSPHPGRIVAVLETPAPAERDQAYRGSLEYSRAVARVIELLESGEAKAGASKAVEGAWTT